jgi:hypothetical protein
MLHEDVEAKASIDLQVTELRENCGISDFRAIIMLFVNPVQHDHMKHILTWFVVQAFGSPTNLVSFCSNTM